MIVSTIDRVLKNDLGRLRFNLKYYARSHPVVITDGAYSWAAFRDWNPDFLRSRLSTKKVVVAHNKEAVFDYNEGAATGLVEAHEMSFESAVNLILSKDGDKHYIQMANMKVQFPELLDDIKARPYLLDVSKHVSVINLWFGGQGCKSPLHFDGADNFLVQISGRKRVTLFPPEENDNLYPATGTNLPHCSRVNVFDPDSQSEVAFPLYRQAKLRKIQVSLEPGNILFIPRGWWHAVESLDVSISVNFWWSGIMRRALFPVREGIPRLFSKRGREDILEFFRQLRGQLWHHRKAPNPRPPSSTK